MANNDKANKAMEYALSKSTPDSPKFHSKETRNCEGTSYTL
ncbi:MAG: hypothetical protein ACI8RD_009126 [Bacillariaceae sp.]|jgi:hypothetical protein